MKRHLFLIDPLAKLTIKKDSSLLLAHTLKSLGHPTIVCFETDFAVTSRDAGPLVMRGYQFESVLREDFYLQSFELGAPVQWEVGAGDVWHMRLDPPFDSRYLKFLWAQQVLQARGVQVVNAPSGILLHNEKISAMALTPSETAPTYLGQSHSALLAFLRHWQSSSAGAWVCKPVDLFQGYGVQKVTTGQLENREFFEQLASDFGGMVLVQPFIPEVHSGEVRCIYFQGQCLGSIVKVPPEGEFLATVARGASFVPHTLSSQSQKLCDRLAAQLLTEGVLWVAFDLLHHRVSEINITCPGLLVEVSQAHRRHLALEMAQKF